MTTIEKGEWMKVADEIAHDAAPHPEDPADADRAEAFLRLDAAYTAALRALAAGGRREDAAAAAAEAVSDFDAQNAPHAAAQ